MTVQKNTISVTELDFAGIKENFKRFLNSSGKFTDFNFEGSAISVLLDLLAANTHYTGFYANMLANEMFLDSAVRRDSVVSHAKAIGYIPTSVRSPRATVNIAFSGITQGADATLPKFTEFIAEKDGISYTFRTMEAYDIDTEEETAVVEGVDIYEGSIQSVSYIADSTLTNQRFVIPDDNVDTQFLEVTVQRSVDDTTGIGDTWTLPPDFTILDGDSKVYFLQEGIGGKYEIYFGDSILGKALEDGNVVTITYLTTEGLAPNDIGTKDTPNAPSFVLSSNDFDGTVTVTTPSVGGSPREGLDTIRNKAVKYWQSQDRAVTASDYETLILQQYPYAESVFVWGGEDNSPPQYGKVFISIKPRRGFVIGETEKNYISKTILRPKNVVTITPEIVDPDYLYILADITVLYDPTRTKLSANDIGNSAKLAAIAYDVINLEKFDSDLRFSKFTAAIDMSHNAIISNTTRLTMQKRLKAIPGKAFTYEIAFNNPIYQPDSPTTPTVKSDTFIYKNSANATVTAFFEDDGSGILNIWSNDNGSKTLIKSRLGVVDYAEGTVKLSNFVPVSLNDTYLKVNATPVPATDIVGLRNNLTKIDFSDGAAVVVKVYSNKAEMNRSASATLKVK